MPVEKRVTAADAFWREEGDEVQLQHAEAVMAIAQRLKFRAKSVRALPLERRARHLAQIGDVSEAVATRALIAYHFAAKRDLMGAFLDALGIEHEEGLIKAEDVEPPPADRLRTATETLGASFPEEDVELYLRTLAALDGDTWAHMDEVLPPSN